MFLDNRIHLEPQRAWWSWNLDLFWVLVPLTAACGYWELGGWETVAYFVAVITNVLLGVVIAMRLLGFIVSIASRDRMLISFAKGAAYSAAIIYAWPNDWMGYAYIILIITTLCLMEIRRPKKG